MSVETGRITTHIPARPLHEVSETITVRQRRSIGIALIARTVCKLYPRRTLQCFSLFVGQPFLYNAFFFPYGDTLTTSFDVKQAGWYIAVFAASNFLLRDRHGPTDRTARPRLVGGADHADATTQGQHRGERDRQVFHEMGQIVRALEAKGPQSPEQLAELLGAAYWEPHRFDRARALVVQDGLAHRTSDGRLAAS